MTKRIVGFCGLKGSGKNTVSNIILNELNNSDVCYEVAFADSVKEVCSSIFGWEFNKLLGDTEESRKWREIPDEFWSKKLGYEFTPRKALQTIGTDLFRDHFNENIWVDSLEARINELYGPENINKNVNVFFNITDVRFKNEIDFIRENNGIIIEIKREVPSWYDVAKRYNNNNAENIPEELLGVHPSEYSYIGVANPDFVIDNSGSLKETKEKVKEIIPQIKK